MVFEKLEAWQNTEGISDAELARRIGCAHTTIARAKRGEFFLNGTLKAAIRDETEGEIGFVEWAEFEEAVTAERSPQAEAAA